LTCSELVAQAGVAAAVLDGGAAAGELPPPEAEAGAVGLAGAVDPGGPGWLPDDAHPAAAAAQISTPATRAGQLALEGMA
jgi:hypothetical protein